jgi:phage/plasmid-associated DNA primase
MSLNELFRTEDVMQLQEFGHRLVPSNRTLRLLSEQKITPLEIQTLMTSGWNDMNMTENDIDYGTIEAKSILMGHALLACWKRRTDDMLSAASVPIQNYDRFGIGNTWPPKTPPEAMVTLLDSIGDIITFTDRSTTVLFIATLDQLIGTDVAARYLNAPALFKNIQTINDRYGAIDVSLGFAEHSSPDIYPVGSYLYKMSPTVYVNYIVTLRNSLRQAFLAAKSILRIHVPTEDIIDQEVRTLSWIYEPQDKQDDMDGLNPQQKLLEFIFDKCGLERLRRADASIYRQKYTEDGTGTCFFERHMDIIDFIYNSVSPKSAYPEMYNAVTHKKDVAENVTKLLQSMPDPRLPIFDSDRCLFSFRNGIFNARNGIFYYYVTIPGMDMHSTKELSSATLCTSNYFDVYITREHLLGSIDDIKTPCFDKILLDQRYGQKDLYWFQAMLGRTLHDIGTMDDWQLCLYVRGVAGSGKSTVLRLWSEVYPKHLVGFLADDSETTFSDQHLINARMICCLDVSKEFRMATTRFNSYVCGENVVVNRKFKTALTVQWKAQLIFASNDNPPIKSRAGSGGRRLLIFRFEEPVRDSDPLLMSKCRAELPFFLIKCARRYLDAFTNYKGQSLWEKDVLPTQCLRARDEYVCSSSPIAAFFASGLLETGDTYIMTYCALRTAYEEYLKTMQSTSFKDRDLDKIEVAVELCRLRSIRHEKGPYNPVKYPDLARFDVHTLDIILPVGQRVADRIYGLRLCTPVASFF